MNRKFRSERLTDIKLHGGDILINGEHVTVRHQLSCGEKLTVVFPIEKKSETLKAEKIALDIVYEDDYVLVLNKPPFMNTIPSSRTSNWECSQCTDGVL